MFVYLSIGPQGVRGDNGTAGPKGYRGIPGHPGHSGFKGSNGSLGATGEKGDQGQIGVPGMEHYYYYCLVSLQDIAPSMFLLQANLVVLVLWDKKVQLENEGLGVHLVLLEFALVMEEATEVVS